jgi:hypothetical protein
MAFSTSIVKSISPHITAGYSYGFKVENSGHRTIVDAEFFVQLRIRGLFNDRKEVWKVLFVPLSYHRIPRMRPARKYNVRDVIRLSIDQLNELATPLFPAHIQEKHRAGTVLLEDLMGLGEEATVQVIAFGYDEFSGARKVFESCVFIRKDIIQGAFERSSLAVIPDACGIDRIADGA